MACSIRARRCPRPAPAGVLRAAAAGAGGLPFRLGRPHGQRAGGDPLAPTAGRGAGARTVAAPGPGRQRRRAGARIRRHARASRSTACSSARRCWPVRRRATSCSRRGRQPVTARPFHVGAPVFKNVAGYDLPRLLCGSDGRLARLQAVTLQLRPAPVEAWAWRLEAGPGAGGGAPVRPTARCWPALAAGGDGLAGCQAIITREPTGRWRQAVLLAAGDPTARAALDASLHGAVVRAGLPRGRGAAVPVCRGSRAGARRRGAGLGAGRSRLDGAAAAARARRGRAAGRPARLVWQDAPAPGLDARGDGAAAAAGTPTWSSPQGRRSRCRRRRQACRWPCCAASSGASIPTGRWADPIGCWRGPMTEPPRRPRPVHSGRGARRARRVAAPLHPVRPLPAGLRHLAGHR